MARLLWQVPVAVMVALLYPHWWAIGAVVVASFLGFVEGRASRDGW